MDKIKLKYSEISLQSTNLNIRALTKEDSGVLFNLYSDTEIQQFTDIERLRSLSDAQEFINEGNKEADNQDLVFLGIFSRATKDFLGTISLFNIDRKHSFASLGFQLVKDYWGRGIMHESLNHFLKFVFEKLNFHRIEAQTYIENERSLNVLNRLGFIREGQLRQNFLIEGKYEDSYLYSILRTEFIKKLV
jgi:ribosomal-protein-alanine N-acetyltransferase